MFTQSSTLDPILGLILTIHDSILTIRQKPVDDMNGIALINSLRTSMTIFSIIEMQARSELIWSLTCPY